MRSPPPKSVGVVVGSLRRALQVALRSLPALAKRSEQPLRVSAVALATGGGNAWRMALDEIVNTGVDLCPA